MSGYGAARRVVALGVARTLNNKGPDGQARSSVRWRVASERQARPRVLVEDGIVKKEPESESSKLLRDFDPPTRLLGRGGFARVVCARSKKDAREYAVKVVRLASGGDAAATEAAIMWRIGHHDHVVPLHDAWYERSSERLRGAVRAAPRTPRREPPHGGGGGGGGGGWTSSSSSSDESSSSDDGGGGSDGETAPPWSTLNDVARRHRPDVSLVRRRSPWRLCLQLGLCSQGSLHEWLARRREALSSSSTAVSASSSSSWRSAERAIALALARGLRHVHDRGCAHLDLSPKNVLLDDGDMWRIADFGLAQPFDAAPNLAFHGSPAYMAPERRRPPLGNGGLLAGPRVTITRPSRPSPESSDPIGSCAASSAKEDDDLRRADVYSFGVILFELVQPFGSAMERAIAVETLRSDPALALADARHQEPRLARLVCEMTHLDPTRRPTVHAVLADLLDLPPRDAADDGKVNPAPQVPNHLKKNATVEGMKNMAARHHRTTDATATAVGALLAS